MAFSDIIKKLAENSSLSPAEKDELYLESRRLEEAASLFNGMVVPGSSSLKVDGLTANRAQIIDADIQSATAGGGDVMIDGEGIWISNQQAAFGFEDTNGDRFNIYIFSDSNDNLGFINDIQGKGMRWLARMTNGSFPNMYYRESQSVPNRMELRMENSTSGTEFNITDNVILRGGANGLESVLNESGLDIDFRVETDTEPYAIFVDAGLNLVSFLGSPNGTGTLLTLDGGTEKRFEFGGDHYIPIRSSSNPNIYFNEANQDMDFHIEGTTDANLFFLNAGLDSIGIGGDGETSVKLKVTGDERVTGKVMIGSSGSDVQAYVSGSKFVLRYNDGGTVRYKYLDMAGTGVTWVHTTVAP